MPKKNNQDNNQSQDLPERVTPLSGSTAAITPQAPWGVIRDVESSHVKEEEKPEFIDDIPTPWSQKELFFTVGLYFVLKLIFFGSVLLLRQMTGVAYNVPLSLFYFIAHFPPEILALTFILYITYQHKTSLLDTFGLAPEHAINGLISGFFFFVVFLPVTILIKLVLSTIQNSLVIQHGFLSPNTIIPTVSSGSLAFYCLMYLIVVPVLSEIVFRGFLLTFLTKRFNLIIGIVGSSFLFMLFNFSALTFVKTFAVGAMLAFSYSRSHSLITPIIFHILLRLLPLGALIYQKMAIN